MKIVFRYLVAIAVLSLVAEVMHAQETRHPLWQRGDVVLFRLDEYPPYYIHQNTTVLRPAVGVVFETSQFDSPFEFDRWLRLWSAPSTFEAGGVATRRNRFGQSTLRVILAPEALETALLGPRGTILTINVHSDSDAVVHEFDPSGHETRTGLIPSHTLISAADFGSDDCTLYYADDRDLRRFDLCRQEVSDRIFRGDDIIAGIRILPSGDLPVAWRDRGKNRLVFETIDERFLVQRSFELFPWSEMSDGQFALSVDGQSIWILDRPLRRVSLDGTLLDVLDFPDGPGVPALLVAGEPRAALQSSPSRRRTVQ